MFQYNLKPINNSCNLFIVSLNHWDTGETGCLEIADYVSEWLISNTTSSNNPRLWLPASLYHIHPCRRPYSWSFPTEVYIQQTVTNKDAYTYAVSRWCTWTSVPPCGVSTNAAWAWMALAANVGKREGARSPPGGVHIFETRMTKGILFQVLRPQLF